MRELILAFLTVGAVVLLPGQNIDSNAIYSHTQLIQNGGITFVESEGYDVAREYIYAQLDKKGLKKIKRRFKIPKDQEPTISEEFPKAQIFRAYEEIDGERVIQRTYYCYESGPLLVEIIGTAAISGPDQALEEFLVKSLKQETFPEYVHSTMFVDSINFAGRYIQLGSACSWRGAHNLQCPNRGQMNWSEFSSPERAEEMILNQQKVTRSRHLVSASEIDTVRIIFEGQETVATRNKLKVKLPKLLIGGSNVLIVYYVICEVRGRYVACVLSHYDDEADGGLPPLLREVMEFAK